MNTKKVTVRFIILIPHRDAAKRLEEYRLTLFSGGMTGAFAFPAAAPLAEIVRPFSREELKDLAQNIRRLAGENTVSGSGKINGKFMSTGENVIAKASQMSFFGPALNLSISEEAFPEPARGNIVRIFNPPVLSAAVVKSDRKDQVINPANIPVPDLSFRAASLANLAISPLASGAFRNEVSTAPEFSFEWKISETVWLPGANKKQETANNQ